MYLCRIPSSKLLFTWCKTAKNLSGKKCRSREKSMLSMWEISSVCRTNLSRPADFWRPWNDKSFGLTNVKLNRNSSLYCPFLKQRTRTKLNARKCTSWFVRFMKYQLNLLHYIFVNLEHSLGHSGHHRLVHTFATYQCLNYHVVLSLVVHLCTAFQIIIA